MPKLISKTPWSVLLNDEGVPCHIRDAGGETVFLVTQGPLGSLEDYGNAELVVELVNAYAKESQSDLVEVLSWRAVNREYLDNHDYKTDLKIQFGDEPERLPESVQISQVRTMRIIERFMDSREDLSLVHNGLVQIRSNVRDEFPKAVIEAKIAALKVMMGDYIITDEDFYEPEDTANSHTKLMFDYFRHDSKSVTDVAQKHAKESKLYLNDLIGVGEMILRDHESRN